MPSDRSGNWLPPATINPSFLHAPIPSGHPYDSLVPLPTTQTPSQLLDEYYSAKRNKPDWTDPNGLWKDQWKAFRKQRNNARAAVGSQGSVGRQERPNCHTAVPVPVHGVDLTLDNSQVVVRFRGQHQRGPSIGVHMVTLHGNSADHSRLQGAEDIVLGELWMSEINFIIAWPGYQPERFPIRIVSANGGPMTRFALGERLALAYAVFFKKVGRERLLPRVPSCFDIAFHQDANGRSNSLSVQFMQLHLVGLRKTVSENWVADVEIV